MPRGVCHNLEYQHFKVEAYLIHLTFVHDCHLFFRIWEKLLDLKSTDFFEVAFCSPDKASHESRWRAFCGRNHDIHEFRYRRRLGVVMLVTSLLGAERILWAWPC